MDFKVERMKEDNCRSQHPSLWCTWLERLAAGHLAIRVGHLAIRVGSSLRTQQPSYTKKPINQSPEPQWKGNSILNSKPLTLQHYQVHKGSSRPQLWFKQNSPDASVAVTSTLCPRMRWRQSRCPRVAAKWNLKNKTDHYMTAVNGKKTVGESELLKTEIK